ncbi:hypothetical protein [Xanthomonas euvesicatoria]|uniref:hypothetical protein n=1 Tax=Xanthomonas euvesicatoria TaxID=456327 RepID=UPI001C4603B1|nr:hypothetical protein [Xanthomonas euvesicatoria]MBV6791649.1 hypothetical protein [Xanthomonas campestris pv. clerodendri]
MTYEVLYLFQSPQGYLVEIQRLDLPADAPKSRIYNWLWLTDRSVTNLRFLDMQTGATQVRDFKEGRLRFDDTHAELAWRNGEVVALMPATEIELGPLQQQLIRNHLS